MLSVGAIRFEDRFCASRKGEVGQGEVGQGEVGQGEVGQGEVGGATAVADRAWWLLQLAIEKARSALDGPLFCFLIQTGVENGPFTL